MFKLQSYNDESGIQGWTHEYIGHGISDEDACTETLDEAIRQAKELIDLGFKDLRIIEVERATDDTGNVRWDQDEDEDE